jgi:amino-acid N-acetyltransferase
MKSGNLLLELYTRDGSGTLISNHHYESLNQASIDDISGILDLIRPLERKGILIRRSREQLELEITNFIVLKRDQKVIACAALYPMKSANMGELACFVVDYQYRGQQKGDILFNFIENMAKQRSLTQLLVLTTQTTDWFRERGFNLGGINDLPEEKKKLYNYQRNSKILLKSL